MYMYVHVHVCLLPRDYISISQASILRGWGCRELPEFGLGIVGSQGARRRRRGRVSENDYSIAYSIAYFAQKVHVCWKVV